MSDTYTVRKHVDEEGRLYLELGGIKGWIRRRLKIRARVRAEAIASGSGDPGPLTALELLIELEKVTR